MLVMGNGNNQLDGRSYCACGAVIPLNWDNFLDKHTCSSALHLLLVPFFIITPCMHVVLITFLKKRTGGLVNIDMG